MRRHVVRADLGHAAVAAHVVAPRAAQHLGRRTRIASEAASRFTGTTNSVFRFMQIWLSSGAARPNCAHPAEHADVVECVELRILHREQRAVKRGQRSQARTSLAPKTRLQVLHLPGAALAISGAYIVRHSPSAAL